MLTDSEVEQYLADREPYEAELPDPVLPPMPAWLVEDVPVQQLGPPGCAEVGCLCWLDPELGCEVRPAEPAPVEAPVLNRSGAPAALVAQFSVQYRLVQAHTARMWRAAAALVGVVGTAKAEFVGDDLALVMNVHPRTGQHLVHTATAADELPGLLAAMQAGELNDRHVHALLEEAGRWTSTPQAAQQVLELTLARCRDRLAQGLGWPTPAQLRKRVRTAALLLDLTAAEKAKKSAADRRGVSVWPVGPGAGQLVIEGPDVMVAQMMDAIRARAEALGRLPGDQRTLQQRMFDAAHELLSVDADGGPSAVPTLDDDAQLIPLKVRGVELSVLVPFSVAVGGDLELAEIPGYGPILPSTARELFAHADHLQRVSVDAGSGRVLTVDDPLPGPGQPTAAPATPATPVQALLNRLAGDPVTPRDLSSSSYRPPGRLRRLVELRDRTCTFPGCTLPGHWCDLDHRTAWPHGETSERNLHCLCRRHHRAKQAYFTVIQEPDGTTIWITPDGRRYRRPPPFF